MLPLPGIMDVMNNKTSPTRAPQRVHLHAYERLSRLCAEIQRGRYPTKADLAHVVELSARTVQNDLRAMVNDFGAPLEFDRAKNGWYFTDPAWRLPSIALTEGELISFFAAERMLRRLGAASEVQLARSAVRVWPPCCRKKSWSFPRSQGRGSIEASSLRFSSSGSPTGFHVHKDVAPLKPFSALAGDPA